MEPYNEWNLIAGGGGTQLSEPKSRIAITFDNIGLGLRTAMEHKGSHVFGKTMYRAL